MSILGIDIGSSACVLATVQKGALTIVRNDLSERCTPTLVGFTDKERFIGEEARSRLKSNLNNTCRYFKQIMGLTNRDVDDLAYEQTFALAPIACSDEPSEAGLAGHKVRYLGEQQLMLATRSLAALLTSLKTLGETYLHTPIGNVVIGVPAWYHEAARQGVIDAARIAGLQCLRVMNEHAAVALDYGMFRASTFEPDKVYTVAFVGIGHASSFVSVVEFKKNQFKIKSCVTNKRFGGRNMDMSIMEHFATQFDKKHGSALLSSPKARLKLEEAATKMKKMLSANSDVPINIDCIYDDHELSGLLTRTDFEDICSGFKSVVRGLLEEAITHQGIDLSTIQSVELVGGCSRVPWVQAEISKFFNEAIPLSRTLSMDETVARGCALQAAILHPRFRVKDISMSDFVPTPITLCYYSSKHGSDAPPSLTTSKLFDKLSLLGSRKNLTFSRHGDFEFQLRYEDCTLAPLTVHVRIPSDKITVKEISRKVKICVRVSHDGILTVESAHVYVEHEVVEPPPPKSSSQEQAAKTPAENPPDAQMDPAPSLPDQGGAPGSQSPSPEPQVPTANPTSEGPASESKREQSPQVPIQPEPPVPEMPTTRTSTVSYECPFTCDARTGFLLMSYVEELVKKENEMLTRDSKQRKLRETINDMESFIYKTRDDLSSSDLARFGTADEVQACLESLREAQEWMYDETDASTTQELYDEKFGKLRQVCDPLRSRQSQYEDTQHAFEDLFKQIGDLKSSYENPQADWSHVPADKMTSLTSKVDGVERWATQVAEQLRATPLHAEAPVKPSAIRQERELLVNFAKTILVAKPAPPKPEEPPAAPENGETTDNAPPTSSDQPDVESMSESTNE